MGVFGTLPNYAALSNIQSDQASEVYDLRGTTLGKYYIENRVNADSSELPKHLVEALVATEDARFFEHGGVDIRSLARVFFRTMLMQDESSGGGSTISQQLAKNLYPREEYGYLGIAVSKVKEMLTARRLEKIYSKDRILRLYLNTVPFGGNAYGIKIAAQRYFNKGLELLSIDEGAVLIGMLKATSYYNPHRYPERAKLRRNVVLSQMAKAGYLEEKDVTKFSEMPIKLNYQKESHDLGLATYFREHLRHEVQSALSKFTKEDGSSYNLYTDGLRIFTTLDATLQRYAEESVKEHLSGLQRSFAKEWQGREPWATKEFLAMEMKKSTRYKQLERAGKSEGEIRRIFEESLPMTIFDWEQGEKEVEMTPMDSIRFYLSLLQTGMLVADPASGKIRAWVGGVDHRYIQYDHVKSRRQIGSTMKPIVYAAALRSGVRPCAYLENSLVQYTDYKDWEPRNSDGNYGGYYSMEGALSHSVNTVTVDLAFQAGVPEVRELATSLGIDTYIAKEPAIALGAVEASLWQMVSVYATFANAGARPDLQFLDRIETQDGTVLLDNTKKKNGPFEQVLSSEEANILTHLMQSVVDSGTARRLRYEYGVRGDIAGKTGTTQNQSDGWFMGYTPKLIAGVWVGAESPSVHFRSTRIGQGANSALPIWGRFMRKVQGNKHLSMYRGGEFEALSDSVLMELDCPPYLEELPEIFDSIADFEELLKFSQEMDEIDQEQLGDLIRKAPRRQSETLSEYSERIRDRNDKVLKKRERKAKREGFWDRLRGKKK